MPINTDAEMGWSISRTLNRIANTLEIVVCFVLILVIILTLLDLILDFTNRPLISSERVFDFDYFLSRALNLVIGIEFTRMLCRHTPDTIIEVLMFATARQLITEHPTTTGLFLGICSIAILFSLRIFLLPGADGARPPFLSFRSKAGKEGADAASPPDGAAE